MAVDAQRVGDILGGRQTLRRVIRTPQDLRIAVEEGLPVRSLDRVVGRVFKSATERASFKWRIVPRTTLRRRAEKPNAKLTPEESERTERLARITALAEQVFEQEPLAHEFLRSAQPSLGGERPVDLTRSDLGTREVEDLLYAIEYSLPV